jgi:2-polyprenyl-3-methyl-5-hydroxy-6-metoxy-1,4-benzoquinol methylase
VTNISWQAEKEHQETFPWERAKYFATFNNVLGHYQATSCLEHARGSSALDLPCGDGTLTRIFTDHFKRVVGVDASTQHLAEARKRAPKAEFREGLIEEIELDEKFGSIFMLNVLEHVIDPAHAIRRAARFLEPDGVLIAHVPNAEALNRHIAVRMGTLASLGELSPFDLNVAGHRRYYTLDSLTKDFKDAGLKVSVTGGIFLKMLSTPQMDWFLEHGEWEKGGFGWGRVGEEKSRDWRSEFCRACYEIGKERPRDCNVVFACGTRT